MGPDARARFPGDERAVIIFALLVIQAMIKLLSALGAVVAVATGLVVALPFGLLALGSAGALLALGAGVLGGRPRARRWLLRLEGASLAGAAGTLALDVLPVAQTNSGLAQLLSGALLPVVVLALLWRWPPTANAAAAVVTAEERHAA